MTDTVESFSTMLRKALGYRIDADASTFLEMVADDGVMEFPFSPQGFPTRLDGMWPRSQGRRSRSSGAST